MAWCVADVPARGLTGGASPVVQAPGVPVGKALEREDNDDDEDHPGHERPA
jgi:hypothetical protein